MKLITSTSKTTLAAAFIFCVSNDMCATNAYEFKPIEIGGRRELFVDMFMVDHLNGAKLQMHAPIDRGVAIKFSQKWEGAYAGYASIIRDGGKIRMYYRGVSALGKDGNANERTLLAESKDGITWGKPNIGKFGFDGSTVNNIVLANAAPVTANFTPMLDTRPGVPASERYKAIGGIATGIYAYKSADGVNWSALHPKPVITAANVPMANSMLFDSQNVVFWSAHENTYVCYLRVWDKAVRKIARTTSKDFKTWSPAIMMVSEHNAGGTVTVPADEQFYTNQTAPYPRAPHIYISTAARFFAGKKVLTQAQAQAIKINPTYASDTSDAVLMSTRGGTIYDRTFLEAFVRPGGNIGNWGSRSNYPAFGMVQTSATEMSMYVGQDYAQPTAHMRRYSMRVDGFSSLSAGASGGEMTTKPFTFKGKSLEINFSTSAGGAVKFEMQNDKGVVIPGFSLDDCNEQTGDEIGRTVTWKSGRTLSDLAGKTVKMRVRITDGDLYSFVFKNTNLGVK